MLDVIAIGTLLESSALDPIALRLGLLAALPTVVGFVAGIVLARATGGLRDEKR